MASRLMVETANRWLAKTTLADFMVKSWESPHDETLFVRPEPGAGRNKNLYFVRISLPSLVFCKR